MTRPTAAANQLFRGRAGTRGSRRHARQPPSCSERSKVKVRAVDGSKTDARPRARRASACWPTLTLDLRASFVSHVRRALAEDSQRVHAFLAGMCTTSTSAAAATTPASSDGKLARAARRQRQPSSPPGSAIPEVGARGTTSCTTPTAGGGQGLRGVHDDVAAQEPARRQRLGWTTSLGFARARPDADPARRMGRDAADPGSC